ncbi:MAG TPA: hypothetical protein VMD75_12545 [Candidatus Binataceae bacterium]|nr:hypothetical protein [Candidatus Binataceae bacterium]
MREALRPMSLGEILDRTFHIYRSRFFVFLVVAAMPLTVKMVLLVAGFLFNQVIGQTTLSLTIKRQLTAGVDWSISRVAGSLLAFGIWFVIVFLAAEIVTQETLSVRVAFSKCLVRWRSWLLASGLLWLIGSEIPHQLRTARFLLTSWLSMPFWLMSIVVSVEGFVLIAPLCLSIPVWALEGMTPLNAIARSWTLSKRAYGRMFMAWLMKDMIAYSIDIMLGGLMFLFFRFLAGSYGSALNLGRNMLWLSLPGYLSSILIGPLFPIALTLIYYDQRIRLEGYDIERMMDAAGMNSTASELIPTAVAGSVELEESQG